jgi:SAM-dependent methyltransferase
MSSAPLQGELWGRQPANWAGLMEPQVRPLYEITLDALEPLAGVRLLDAGCGAGLSMQIAAGRGARVSGLDASAPLLDIARTRTPGADLRVGDIEALPFDASTFDVVCAFNAIQYAVEPAAAVAELARVCRSGGRVAIGTWGEPARCETEALFARLRALAPPPPGAPTPLVVSGAGMVEDLLDKAGMVVAGGGEGACPLQFADHDAAYAAHTAAGPVQKAIDVAGPDAVRSVLREVLEADRKPDGTLRQDNVFRYVVGAMP